MTRWQPRADAADRDVDLGGRVRTEPALLGLALGVTLCLVALGYLVLAAIDFGSDCALG